MLHTHNQIQICSGASEKNLTVLPAADIVCLLLKEGVVCGALCRQEQDYHAHYDQKDMCVLFHRIGSISSDKSRSMWINHDLIMNAAIVVAVVDALRDEMC